MHRITYLYLSLLVTDFLYPSSGDEDSLVKIHSGNLCTVLCSRSSSTVLRQANNDAPTDLSPNGGNFLWLDKKHAAQVEFIKRVVQDNSKELSLIRDILNKLVLERQVEPEQDFEFSEEGVRLARAGGTLLPPPFWKSLEEQSPQAVSAFPVEKLIKTIPTDCDVVRNSLGRYFIGRYYTKISPVGDEKPFIAGCEMREDAAWMIIQKRSDGLLSFHRSWDEYRNGFGNAEGDFWLGNEKMHQITSQKTYRLRIELRTGSGREFYAEYSNFKVGSERSKYQLHLSGYTGGSAGDSLTGILTHNGSLFSTYDRDNDKYEAGNCAAQYHGGWWFHSCFVAYLNGVIAPPLPPPTPTRRGSPWRLRKRSFYVPVISKDGVVWRTINKRQVRDSAYYNDVAIKTTMMMISSA